MGCLEMPHGSMAQSATPAASGTRCHGSHAIGQLSRGPRRKVLAICALLAALWLLNAPGYSEGPSAFSLFRKKKPRWYESLPGGSYFKTHKVIRTQSFPWFQFQKQIRPLELAGLLAEVETAPENAMQFPFRSDNTVALSLGLPKVDGRLDLKFKDPEYEMLESDEPPQVAEVGYSQPIPKVGKLAGRLSSNGEWGLSVQREVENIGLVDGSISSNSEWGIGLNASYPPYRGISPRVIWKLSQDGVGIKAAFSAPLRKHLKGMYTIENEPGTFKPQDFLHNLYLTLAPGSRQRVDVQAQYHSKYPRAPVRASAQYTLQSNSKKSSLIASVDSKKYQLRLKQGWAQASLALDQADMKPTSNGTLALTLWKVRAGMRFDGLHGKRRFAVGMAF